MAGTQLSSCCLSGHLHEGTPQGKFADYAGFNTYVSNAEAKEKTIVMITDIFGVQLNNIKLLADEYAITAKARVLVPDFFLDDSVPVEHMKTMTPLHSDPQRSEEELKAAQGAAFGSCIGPWLERQKDDVVRPRIDTVVAQAAEEGKVGVVGFCWGATQALLLAGQNDHVAAIVANHPSFAAPEVFKAIKKPTLIQAPTEDPFFPKDHSKNVQSDIAERKDCSFVYFDQAVHGFACRGDLNNKDERQQQEQATRNSIDHLLKYL